MKSKFKSKVHSSTIKSVASNKNIPKEKNEKNNPRFEEISAMGKRVGDWVQKKFAKRSYI